MVVVAVTSGYYSDQMLEVPRFAQSLEIGSESLSDQGWVGIELQRHLTKILKLAVSATVTATD